MNEEVDKVYKQETARLAAQLQQSRIKSDTLKEALEHELERQRELIGAMNEVKRLVEQNV
jgi:hypothetical protein